MAIESSTESVQVVSGTPAAPPEILLTDRQWLILETMFDKQITSREAKVTREEIVRLANPKADHENFSHDFSYLRNLGYTESSRGNNGGIWLTSNGCEAVKAKLQGR